MMCIKYENWSIIEIYGSYDKNNFVEKYVYN